MEGLPTDRILLRAIYTRHLPDYLSYTEENQTRSSKIFVPLDLEGLSKDLGIDPDILFGRLYYHLNGAHSQVGANADRSEFFSPRIGADRHCINFPMLTSVLADLQDRHRQFLTANMIASFSLVISLISVFIAIWA